MLIQHCVFIKWLRIIEDCNSEIINSVQPEAIASELPEQARQKLEIIQSLLEPCDRATYGERLRDSSQKLKISVRSVQRLFKRYQDKGLTALTDGDRKDKGLHRISNDWENFIVNAYKQGNKGSKRMSPKQVALRLEGRALEIGDSKPPCYRTVLRVLTPIINKQKKVFALQAGKGLRYQLKPVMDLI